MQLSVSPSSPDARTPLNRFADGTARGRSTTKASAAAGLITHNTFGDSANGAEYTAVVAVVPRSPRGMLWKLFDFRWREIEPETMFTSHFVSDWVLHAYRCCCSLFCLATLLWAVLESFGHGTWFTYFTNLNYTVLTVYFLLHAVRPLFHACSCCSDSRRTLSRVLNVLGEAEWTNALYLDIIYWAMLWPIERDPSPSFLTFVVHMVNFLLIFVDLLLSRMVFIKQHVWTSLTFLALYAVFTQIYYVLAQEWIYPFLDTSTTLFPVIYIVIFLFHFFIFACGCMAVRMREWLARGSRRHNSQEVISPKSGATLHA